jgi:hypothetical protein
MEKVISKFMARRDTEAFREPVNHVALGLVDYLVIVKRPMDLGTVRYKFNKNQYKALHECAADIRLVWANAMLYNQPGSRIHQVAQQFSEEFEAKYSAIAKDDKDKPPSLEEMKDWCDKYFRLTPEQGGRILMHLEKVSPKSLSKSSDGMEVDVNVDMMSGAVFRGAIKMMEKFLPDFEPKKPKRKYNMTASSDATEGTPTKKLGTAGGDVATYGATSSQTVSSVFTAPTVAATTGTVASTAAAAAEAPVTTATAVAP